MLSFMIWSPSLVISAWSERGLRSVLTSLESSVDFHFQVTFGPLYTFHQVSACCSFKYRVFKLRGPWFTQIKLYSFEGTADGGQLCVSRVLSSWCVVSIGSGPDPFFWCVPQSGLVPVHGAPQGSLPALEDGVVFLTGAGSTFRQEHLISALQLLQLFTGHPETYRDTVSMS